MAVVDMSRPPRDPQSWARFSFANAVHHHDIIRVMLRDRGVVLDEFVLDPVPVDDLDAWLHLHATMHQQQNAALGIQGYDLSQLDTEDPESFETWISQHADEHYRAGLILNLE